MKIATLTFHWATNYGAVMQAYALQKYLKQRDFDIEIINYIPLRIKMLQSLRWIRKIMIKEFIKERKIKRFRKQYLNLSQKSFYSNKSLVNNCHKYDQYICGSDQIWNEYFTLYGEGKPTLSYYLNFVRKEKPRISYATSFGTDKLSPEVINIIRPELLKFKHISVRENTGRKMIQDMGFNAELVIDPVLLLEREVYEELIKDADIKKGTAMFSYILHENQITASRTKDYISKKYFYTGKNDNHESLGVCEWLFTVKNAELVLTNSYHGVIFSVLFHTPFIVVPVEDSNMNNRITTFLKAINLESQILVKFDQKMIDKLLSNKVEWDNVDERVSDLRTHAMDFLKEALSVSTG